MNKKIGIISLNRYTRDFNLGAALHSWAFQKYLTKVGEKPTIVNYLPNHQIGYDFGVFSRQVDPTLSDVSRFQLISRKLKIQNFIKKHYNSTDDVWTSKMLESRAIPDIDNYIVATDVVWRPFPKFDPTFFLANKGLVDKNKIIYSVSKGIAEYNAKQEKEFFELVKSPDSISVRDQDLKKYLEEHGVNADVTIDPTLLLDKEDYTEIIKKPKVKRPYVFAYSPQAKGGSNKMIKIAAEFAKKHDLDLIEVSPYPKNKEITKYPRHKVVFGVGVEEWLGYFKDAEYIFTNAYHGACISMIFEKEFWGFRRSPKPELDKVGKLLRMIGLEDRMLQPGRVPKDNKIDYSKVNSRRFELAENSKKWLEQALNQ
jgi:hypothetical protein